MSIGAIISALMHLKRVCPRCKRVQIVPVSKRRSTVSCKFCSAKIPATPPRSADD